MLHYSYTVKDRVYNARRVVGGLSLRPHRSASIKAFPFKANPHAHRFQRTTQVTNMPVGAIDWSPMPRYPGSNTTLPEGASNVNVVSSHKFDPPQPPHINGGGRIALKEQSVGSGIRR